ncbi:hypothetical protein HN827_02825 [archaeon]|jgi:hypothetical protein|nr:hypothetical protein [archaeon]MBT4647186.1 hypothetical protein [archaeon]MBT6822189.1 hypothetical protein [archaeon]MBT7391736.1 hypothetical protein [archaeon]
MTKIKLFDKLRSKFVHSKIFYQRALGYISIINSSMILFLFLSNLEKYGIDIDLKNWFVPLLIIGVIGLIFVGYMEDKLGIFTAESGARTKRNPQMQMIIDKLEAIEKDVEEIKNKRE